MKNTFWAILLMAIWQCGFFGFIAYMMHLNGKIPDVAILAAMMGFIQIQTAGDTTKIQNDIFDFKEWLKKKLTDSK